MDATGPLCLGAEGSYLLEEDPEVMKRLPHVPNSRQVRKVWNKRFSLEDVKGAFHLDTKQAVLVLRTLGVIDPERFEQPPPPREEISRLAVIDGLLDGACYLTSDELAEELARPLTQVDYDHAAVCAEARKLKISGSRASWRIRP